MKKISALIFSLIFSLTLASGCSQNFSTKTEVFYAMQCEGGLVISEQFNGGREKEFEGLTLKVKELLINIDNSLSVGIESSYVNKFNSAAAGETVEVDFIFYDVMKIAKKMYNFTDGYYNPAVYYSVENFGFHTADANPPQDGLPSDEDVLKYKALSNAFPETELFEKDGKYYVKKPVAAQEIDGAICALKLDLGGIGKGYAADGIKDIISSYGFKYGYFNFASSSMYCMEHYKNGGYELNFVNPRPENQTSYMRCSVKNATLSTSGDYEKYYTYGGERYCHIIDPTTAKPVKTGIMTATVIGGGAAEGDALSTAIMAMGRDRAKKFISEKLTDRQAAFTYDNGGKYEIYINSEKENFEICDGRFSFGE